MALVSIPEQYRSSEFPSAGAAVLVPQGRRTVAGAVCATAQSTRLPGTRRRCGPQPLSEFIPRPPTAPRALLLSQVGSDLGECALRRRQVPCAETFSCFPAAGLERDTCASTRCLRGKVTGLLVPLLERWRNASRGKRVERRLEQLREEPFFCSCSLRGKLFLFF